jgi:hypothetical protein
MKIRRPRLFGLISLVCVMLCIGIGVMWFDSRRITTAAVPSTYDAQVVLARKVPAINFQAQNLVQAVDRLNGVSNHRIEVDWDALESGGIRCYTQMINPKATNGTMGELLAAILASAGPGTQFTTDGLKTRVTMKGVQWWRPDRNEPDPIREFELRKQGKWPPPPPPKPLGERVVGANRYTLVIGRGMLRLWITPADPAAVYQQSAGTIGGTNDQKYALVGIRLDHKGWPLNTWQIEMPFWALIAVGAMCPLMWMITASRRGRQRRRLERQQCIHCGYDLRATPGRCPECGREASQADQRTPISTSIVN